MIILLLSIVMLTWGVNLLAQNASPVIQHDHSVTFYYNNPNATTVQVEGCFIPEEHKGVPSTKAQRYNMTKANGTWTFTTPKLQSELYTYTFVVDGKTMPDPLNRDAYRDVADTLNYFIIPGNPGSTFIHNSNIAHGNIEKVWYPSQLNGMKQRRMTIYTPACYHMEERNYPVLYLLHGSGGDENAWVEAGKAAEILDNLIAKGTINPMIVVMPNGNVELDAAPGESPYRQARPSALNLSSMAGKFEELFINEIVNFVDSKYKTDRTKSSRAIAGLSLGGLQTIFISACNPGTFDYIGLFSPQTLNFIAHSPVKALDRVMTGFDKFLNDVFPDTDEKQDNNYKLYNDLEAKIDTLFLHHPKLYYIAVGEDDFVMKIVDDFRRGLNSKGYPHIYRQTNGNHSWENWRRYLIDFLPRLSAPFTSGSAQIQQYASNDNFPLAPGKTIYIPMNKEPYAQAGAQTLRDRLSQDGFWQVVDQQEDAEIILEYCVSTSGRDHAWCVFKNKNGTTLLDPFSHSAVSKILGKMPIKQSSRRTPTIHVDEKPENNKEAAATMYSDIIAKMQSQIREACLNGRKIRINTYSTSSDLFIIE